MPYSYRIDRPLRLVISTACGRVAFAEILAHQDRLLSDSEFSPEFNQLVDGTEAIALDISGYEARTVASRQIFSATSRRAFVSPGPAIPGVGLLMAAYQEAGLSSQVQVFYNMPSAYGWLQHGTTSG